MSSGTASGLPQIGSIYMDFDAHGKKMIDLTCVVWLEVNFSVSSSGRSMESSLCQDIPSCLLCALMYCSVQSL